MIYIIYGNDRLRAEKEMRRILGEEYEVFDGAEIAASDLPSIFMGTTLFALERKILIKELAVVRENFEKLPEYLGTKHTVVIWEEKMDKRSTVYKKIKDVVKILEFELPEKIDRNLVFNIYDTALSNGVRAVKMLEKIETEQDPFMIVGAFAWKAIDNYRRYGSKKEERILAELSLLDIQMKSTAFSPFSLLKSFLLQVSSL